MRIKTVEELLKGAGSRSLLKISKNQHQELNLAETVKESGNRE